MPSLFCEHLRKAVEDENLAGPDYIKLLGELESDKDQPDTAGKVDDLSKISDIANDEDRHHSILEQMYERRCRTPR